MAHFLPFLQGNEQNTYLKRLKRRLREENNQFDLPDQRFTELFRFTKESMEELIELLEPHLGEGLRRHRVPKNIRILAAMRFFATGSYQRCVGQDAFVNLSQSQISLAIHEVATAIVTHLSHFISFPQPGEYPEMKATMMERYNIPGVIGIVDGTHIAIGKPTLDREHQYLNRKGFHSKNVQIVCGPDNKILSINAAHGGASHDAFIWRVSNINNFLLGRFQGGDRHSWLLGDSGYPLMPYLLTPFRNPAPNSPEFRYNVAHRRARSCVERCIGILKARFRCLIQERMLKYSPERAGTIINACAILHNMMVAWNLPLPPEEDILNHMDPPDNLDLNENAVDNGPLLNAALQTRARVARDFFNN